MAEDKIGVVIHYWTKIGVAGIDLTDGELKVGDTIHVLGHTSDFNETVNSIHIGEGEVEVARTGDKIGVKVSEHARQHDEVFKIAAG